MDGKVDPYGSKRAKTKKLDVKVETHIAICFPLYESYLFAFVLFTVLSSINYL